MTVRSEAGRGRGPMSYQRRHLTITAACATVLSSLPLATVYIRWTWLLDAAIAVAVLCGLALALRTMRLPVWTPTLAMLAALPVVLSVQFPSGEEIAGVVPTPGTLQHFADLLNAAGTYMREDGAPVSDRPSFLFLSTLGIAGVAIIVDLFAVVLRRPAMAGLPMLAIYSVPVAIEEGSVNLLPFALGTIGFLWLLVADSIDRVRRFGRRFSGDGRDVDLWEPSPLASAGQRLGLIGVVLAVAIPLLVPGMTGGLLERFDAGRGLAGGDAGTGATGRVQLDAFLSGNLQRDRAYEMLRVQTNNSDPYYLRYAVADQLTTEGFRNRAAQGSIPANATLPGRGKSAPGTNPRSYRATIEISNLDLRYLPFYQQATRFDGVKSAWRYDERTATVSSRSQRTQKKQRYSFEYVPPQYTADALRAAGQLNRNDPAIRDAMGVPQNRETAELVNRLTAGQQSEYDKVFAIFNYFSPENGFTYSLTTKPGASGSDLLNFLNNKQGFCVQYAAAMAWLVRQAGYPSRVAYGFTRGTGIPGNWTTLSNFNLHAWTEVYFPEYGWVPWDPTPATGVTGSASTAWAPNPSQPEGGGESSAPSASAEPSTEPSATSSTGPDPAAANDTPGGAVGKPKPVTARWPFWVLLGVLSVGTLLAVPGLRRRAVRRRRLHRRAPPTAAFDGAPQGPAGEPVVLRDPAQALAAARQDAHEAWDELLDSMIDYGVAVNSSETPRTTANRLVDDGLSDRAADGVRLLGQAEECARYSRRPLPSGELASSVGTVRAALRARATRWERLRALVLPPSVLRRWRSSVELVFGNATASMVDRRDSVARTMSVRRLISSRTAR